MVYRGKRAVKRGRRERREETRRGEKRRERGKSGDREAERGREKPRNQQASVQCSEPEARNYPEGTPIKTARIRLDYQSTSPTP